MVGFWEKEFDVLVCTTIVESGHRHPERQHADRGAGRPARPGPAAPDPGPGRPGPGAGVRVLPLPAGEAAHRARARAAGHHRPAHRARRRHVRGDEGPGDPRRRQPARRRAVRPHRGRRLRPVRADGRRGGAGSSRASGREEEPPRSRSTCRSTRTCRTTTSRSERLRLEMYRKLAEARDDERAGRGRRRDDATGTASRPSQVANLVAVARFRLLARAYGLTDVSVQGKHIRFAPLPLPDSKQLRLKRYHPDAVYKTATDQVSVPRPMTRRVGGEPLRDLALLTGARSCSRTCSATRGRAPAAAEARAGPAPAGAAAGLAPLSTRVRECRPCIVPAAWRRSPSSPRSASAGLTACRSEPGVAAYVGDQQITEETVTAWVDGAVPAAGQDQQQPAPGPSAGADEPPPVSRAGGRRSRGEPRRWASRSRRRRTSRRRTEVTAEQVAAGSWAWLPAQRVRPDVRRVDQRWRRRSARPRAAPADRPTSRSWPSTSSWWPPARSSPDLPLSRRQAGLRRRRSSCRRPARWPTQLADAGRQPTTPASTRATCRSRPRCS